MRNRRPRKNGQLFGNTRTISIVPSGRTTYTTDKAEKERITDMTLVILAAGMGSRYGGLKQIDPIGPEGEFIIDYSIYERDTRGL